MRKNLFPAVRFALFLLATVFADLTALAGNVAVHDNQLWVDGAPQPQLYGAELQYFRLRGGTEKNIPREKVIALWNQALDRMVEAKMNAISFYIPWDFHEYAEGKFDFTGTADEDGDGRPDYPSRDLVTFFRLVQEHGIRHILVRPGPYINAEWGFLGFGAVPEWFHDKFPDSHMKSADGLHTKLYDYANPDFRRYSQRWITELYRQVLSKFIGPGQPVDFIQLDNETNYMWQSLYDHDYGAAAIGHYHEFLRARYGSLASLNAAQGTAWSSWDAVAAPVKPGVNVAEDRDWYRFHDEAIHEYLHFVRTVWEGLGVREPDVLFTLAESYNATKNGLLPNYQFRNDPGVTGLMTVNMYPKTVESGLHPLLNNPFKADHDVKAATAANAKYFGSPQEWSMGPEVQGGWWRGIDVTQAARKQTYLSTLGHGLKALFIYYFNEGDNWGYDWAQDNVSPLFNKLHDDPAYSAIATPNLPGAFWSSLQFNVDRQLLLGIDAKGSILSARDANSMLYFDAPLDGDANPKVSYALVKEIGQRLIGPYQDFLGRAVEMTDPVCFLKDVNQHAPSTLLDSVEMNSDWAGGLLGYLMQAGINPKVLHWGISPPQDYAACRLIVLQDNGLVSNGLPELLRGLVERGATVVSLLGDTIAGRAGFGVPQATSQVFPKDDGTRLVFDGRSFAASRAPFATYVPQAPASAFLNTADGRVVGYQWPLGKGRFVQISALFYDLFNADAYAALPDVPARRAVLTKLLALSEITPRVRIVEGGDRVTAFGRRSPDRNEFLVTVKSGRGDAPVSLHVALADARAGKKYAITDVFGGASSVMDGAALAGTGVAVTLPRNGSAALYLQER